MKNETIEILKQIKKEGGLTFDRLASKIDFPVNTLKRWFKTDKINRIYELEVRRRLGLF